MHGVLPVPRETPETVTVLCGGHVYNIVEIGATLKGVNPNIVLFWIDSAELKGQECSRAAPDSNRICGSDLPCPQSR
jgi:hypothetical protein